jgi:hypothetical protein
MKPHLRLLTRLLSLILILGAQPQLRAQSIAYFLYATDQGTGPKLEGSTENATYKPLKAVEVLSFAFAGTKAVNFSGGSPAAEFNPLELVIQDDPNILGGLMVKMAAGNYYNDLVLEGAITGAGGGGGLQTRTEEGLRLRRQPERHRWGPCDLQRQSGMGGDADHHVEAAAQRHAGGSPPVVLEPGAEQ